ncbi:hypothetical protein BDQ12DRAFT_688853 [Crucibulum laeve]|uniref:Voltage-gated hydrogen channel 1 n=1 Tax=Crucibulum laeve TaxID=68775 RepID=A0A5C3LSS6_9AGAR|nr:hypothetical protein BDQ12DRAFT_688853 [Crucibulum laeve]
MTIEFGRLVYKPLASYAFFSSTLPKTIMSPSPVLPFHAQDEKKKSGNENGLEIFVPSPSRTPRTPRTGLMSARSPLSAQSSAVERLDAVMSQLDDQHNAFDDEDASYEADISTSGAWSKKFSHFRAHLRHSLHVTAFHYTVIGLVIFDLVIVFIDLVLSMLSLSCYTEEQKARFEELGLEDVPEPSSCLLHESTALNNGEWFLWAVSVFLLGLFVLEIFASLIAFGWRRFLKPLYGIDMLVVFASFIMEIYFRFAHHGVEAGSSPAALVVLRLWKIVRAIHAIAHSIELKNQTIIEEVKEAKRQVEVEHHETEALLRRDRLKIEYLQARAISAVSETELDKYVDSEIQRENRIREKEEEDDNSSNEKAN